LFVLRVTNGSESPRFEKHDFLCSTRQFLDGFYKVFGETCEIFMFASYRLWRYVRAVAIAFGNTRRFLLWFLLSRVLSSSISFNVHVIDKNDAYLCEQTKIFRNRAPLFGIILSEGAREGLHVVMLKVYVWKPTCRWPTKWKASPFLGLFFVMFI
jgi:hypothetical protein